MLYRCSLVLLAVLLGAAPRPAVAADDYPNKPIRIVVGFPPGGVGDIAARQIAASLTRSLGQNVLVDNRPGGNTVLATRLVNGSAPDGYTLYGTFSTPYALNPFLYKKLDYDPTAYTPVAIMVRVPQGVVVRTDSPLRTLADYVKAAKAEPGKMTYGSSGAAAITTILMEAFKREAGIDVLSVPYQGGSPALVALLGSHVDSLWAALPSLMANVKAGQLRVLAVAGNKRLSSVPEVPTFQELGYTAFNVDSWYGIVAPQGTPRDIVGKLNREINREMQTPEMRAWLASQGLEPDVNTPEAMGEEMRAEVPIRERMIKALALSLD